MKGANGEREFLDILTQLSGRDDIKRNLMQTREGGADCAIPLGGTVLEIKRQERLNLPAWLEQVKAAAEEKVPVLAFRRNRENWRVLVELTPQQYVTLFMSGLFDE